MEYALSTRLSLVWVVGLGGYVTVRRLVKGELRNRRFQSGTLASCRMNESVSGLVVVVAHDNFRASICEARLNGECRDDYATSAKACISMMRLFCAAW